MVCIVHVSCQWLLLLVAASDCAYAASVFLQCRARPSLPITRDEKSCTYVLCTCVCVCTQFSSTSLFTAVLHSSSGELHWLGVLIAMPGMHTALWLETTGVFRSRSHSLTVFVADIIYDYFVCDNFLINYISYFPNRIANSLHVETLYRNTHDVLVDERERDSVNINKCMYSLNVTCINIDTYVCMCVGMVSTSQWYSNCGTVESKL